jgi:LuxR family maltose regulon positive regulatory protein
LEYLRSHSLFLTPVEPNGHRLRFHQLFADLLRYQLALEDPEAMSAVRRRAATWLEQNGWQADAGEELVTIGEPTKVLEFVRRHGADFFARNESSTLLRWLDGIALAEGPTDLLIDQLAAEMATHQTARVRMSHRLLTARSDLHSGQLAAVEALYSCAGLDDLPTEEVERAVAATRQHLETALGEGEQVPDFLGIGGAATAEAMASYMGGLASFHSGNLLRATEQLRDTLTLEGMSYPLWKTSALSTLALVRAWSGWHEHATIDARAALELAASAASPHHHAVTHAYLALAATSLDRLEIDLATEHLTEAGICVQRSGWAVDRALHQMLSEKLEWVGDGSSAVPGLPAPAAPPATLPRIIECSLAVNRARQLALAGSIPAARSQLTLCPEGPQRWAGEVDIALVSGELEVALERLARWQPPSRDLRELVGHALRTAVAESAAGRSDRALHTMSEALRQAEPESLRAVFSEVPRALDLIRSEPDLLRSDFAISLVQGSRGGGIPSTHGDLPSEPLTSREAELLPYLPTRLTNAEIADRLFVSVNTVKTHLRHIYWKLDVENRDAAVARAEELGLL